MFSEKQIILINSLLEKLKFEGDVSVLESHKGLYFQYIKNTFKMFRNIGSCEVTQIKINNEVKDFPKNALLNTKYVFNGVNFEINKEHYSLITYLNLEIDIKRNNRYSNIFKPIEYYSATDIANYTYCPVNYSISKSIKYKTLEIATIGTKKHEESLIEQVISKDKKVYPLGESEVEYVKAEIENDENYKSLTELLKDFEIIFNGHSKENKDTFFINKKYRGQPDYILQHKNTKEVIVLEEKYQHIPKEYIDYSGNYYDIEKSITAEANYETIGTEINERRNRDYFYKNHINQVSSYLFGIKEYEIKYALLVYWKYEIRGEEQVVTKCLWKKIEKEEKIKAQLKKVTSDMKDFIKNGKIPFDKKSINLLKCSSCVNNFLCGHKTGYFEVVTIPYKDSFLITNNGGYPEELRNTEVNNQSREERILENIEHNIRHTNDFPYDIENSPI